MNVVRLLPVILSALLMAAHFSRAEQHGLVAVSLMALFLLMLRQRWVAIVIQALLAAAAIEWVRTALRIIQARQEVGEPWTRLAIILGAVALFMLLSAGVFRFRGLRERYASRHPAEVTSAIVFLGTVGLLGIVQSVVALPLLLVERFFPGFGWIEIFLLGMYAQWITGKLMNPQQTLWRQRIWLIFSIVFFAQLAFGLLGIEKMLMTGQLHLPVPAMILTGPIFRGERFFMPILFLSTIILVGPAWCSYLCYVGAWDSLASRALKRPQRLPEWRRAAQIGILVFMILAAIGLRFAGASMLTATILGLLFGIGGVAVMVFWSRKTGQMTHCITYCPIGVLATWLGKASPFRIRITDSCTECNACALVCRYHSLTKEDIRRRRPGIACTLCGDCLASCKHNSLEYRFLKMRPVRARALFIVMIVVLHTLFLGVARI
ncbi:MAG: 4Fe-4S binding protein [Candidatus Zhuqueibacterota bacterium]